MNPEITVYNCTTILHILDVELILYCSFCVTFQTVKVIVKQVDKGTRRLKFSEKETDPDSRGLIQKKAELMVRALENSDGLFVLLY